MKSLKWLQREDTKSLVRGIETVIVLGVFSVLYYLVWRQCYYSLGVFPDYFYNGKYVLIGVYAVLLYIFIKSVDGFRYADLRRTDLILAKWIGLFITNFITYFQLCLIANQMINPLPILALLALEMFVSVIFIFVFVAINRRIYTAHKMLMVYGKDVAVGLKIKLDTRKDKYDLHDLISVDEGYEEICKKIMQYDAVILNDLPAQIRNDILKYCYMNDKRVYVAPKLSDVIISGSKTVSLFDTPLFMVKGTGLNITQRILKRIIDFIGSLIAIIITSPIMLLVALAIKLEDGGPVFYKQDRITRNNKEFKILKFRSMIVDAESKGEAMLATGCDPRITKVGKFIRAVRIDELPQIINILKGDMSIVGPRPERRSFIDEFEKDIPEFEYRLKVKGGLTGYAQVYGKYNTTPYDKLRMDLMYIENYSLLLDIKLILTTIRILFQKESTEGIDKRIENEKLRDEMIRDLNNKK